MPAARHVGITLPRSVKSHMLEAASVMDWSVGRWVLAAAAEHGPRMRSRLGHARVRKRSRLPDAAFTGIYLTDDERAELDDQAIECGLNRSAFVTAVARLALGEDLEDVCAELR